MREREGERERGRERVIMKVKKHFYLKRFDVSLPQLRLSMIAVLKMDLMILAAQPVLIS